MLLAVLFLLIPLLFVKQKHITLYWFSFLYMWVIFGWCGQISDKGIYLMRFEDYDDSWMLAITEPLYTATMYLFHYLGISFQGTYIVVSFFFLSILFWYVNKVSRARNVVLALILISIYAMIVCMYRTTYSIAFIMLAMYVLVYTKLYFKYVIFCCLVIVASCIHSMCILYMVYLLPFFFKKKTIYKWLYICIPLLVIGVGIIHSSILPNIMEAVGLGKKMELFIGDTEGGMDMIIKFVLAAFRLMSVIALPMGICRLLSRKKRVVSEWDNKIVLMNILSLYLLPLLYLSHDLYRVMYVFAIMDFCMATHYIKDKRIFLYTILCAINIGYWFIWRPYFEMVFLPVFTDNLLF